MKDPRQRIDGKCALPGCEKQLPAVARNEGDPFCSVEHVRAYHGCPMPIYGHGLDHTGRERRDNDRAA